MTTPGSSASPGKSSGPNVSAAPVAVTEVLVPARTRLPVPEMLLTAGRSTGAQLPVVLIAPFGVSPLISTRRRLARNCGIAAVTLTTVAVCPAIETQGETTTGGGGGATTAAGVTASVAERTAPPSVAVIVALVAAVTALVVAVNAALDAPAATVTLAGTRATVVRLLASFTTSPPLGAAAVSVIVPADDVPPVTLAGFRLTADSVAFGRPPWKESAPPRSGPMSESETDWERLQAPRVAAMKTMTAARSETGTMELRNSMVDLRGE